VKLTTVALFAAGYVVGARAGHERYAQIVTGAARLAAQLEGFSSSRPPRAPERGSGGSAGGP